MVELFTGMGIGLALGAVIGGLAVYAAVLKKQVEAEQDE